MAWKPRHVLLGFFIGAAALSAEAAVPHGQPIDKTRKICTDVARATEKATGIPRHLLAAISLTETGRFDAERGENFAWPWTVMAEGRGRYFQTKAEAKAEVEILLSQGVRNIDVGCMQINLHFHWDAFDSLDQAFDPAANAAYAAEFLKSKHARTRNWLTAAGQYHSHTPENFRPYRIKVLSYWNKLRRGDAGGSATAKRKDDAETRADARETARVVGIDRERTQRLNGLLRDRRQGSRVDMRQLRQGKRRLAQLDDWRDRQRRGVRLQATVAQRLAEMELHRKEKLRNLERAGREVSFADKRRQQLDRWRRTGALSGEWTGER